MLQKERSKNFLLSVDSNLLNSLRISFNNTGDLSGLPVFRYYVIVIQYKSTNECEFCEYANNSDHLHICGFA